MLKNHYPGKFIVIEGIDGAGKSTQAEILSKKLKLNLKVLTTYEPTNSPIGMLIRKQLKNEWQISNQCLELLFAADRADHLNKQIIPALQNNVIVICDRYIPSSLAYGSIANDFLWIMALNQQFIIPDIIIYLDIDPRISLARLQKERNSLELYEKLETLQKVSQNYKKALNTFQETGSVIKNVDASFSLTQITAQISTIINNCLKNKS